jgi:hypothetical protein
MAQINVKDLAEELETTARTARKFLRSIVPKEDQPGKGGRWQIEKREVRSLKKKFADFQMEHMRENLTEVDLVDEETSN